MTFLEHASAFLGAGKTLYTKARGTKFRAHVAGGVLVIESERSGRKSFAPAIVEAAKVAFDSDAPPVEDRGVQVARSWVGAIADAMAGTPNKEKRQAAKPTAAKAGARAGATRVAASKAGTTKAAKQAERPKARAGTRPSAKVAAAPTPAPRRKSAASPRRTGSPSAPAAVATPAAGPSAADIAVTIGQEIARALNHAASAAERPSDGELARISEQVAALTAQVEASRAERDQAVERAAKAERQAGAWRSSAVELAGVATVAVVAAAGTATSLSSDVAELLAQAAKSWKTAPSGSVAASRTALELLVRDAARRVSGTHDFDNAAFSPVHQFLTSRTGAKGNMAESDLHLARDLYRRSSKSGHAEQGWKPGPLDALLIWSGVLLLADRSSKGAS